MPYATTHLTADITAAVTTIPVANTTGFQEPGKIMIGDEVIAYSATNGAPTPNFHGNIARPLTRGADGTTAVAHSEGDKVRTIESGLINNSISYDIATLSDAAGIQAFLTVPLAIFDIIFSFGIAPFAFLGTDLQILTIIWGICFVGMVVSFFITMAGGRRV